MNKPTRTYDLYEIVKVPFPFTDTKSSKVRPALVLSSARRFNSRIGLSIMAMITSQKPNQDLWPADIVIEDLLSTKLPCPSIIRFKIFTLDHRLILGRLGVLAPADRMQVQNKLQEILALEPP
ncbi:MAG: type II toxin-antitoxin system PemK/MazF family toxin [Chlamydiales bacterium]